MRLPLLASPAIVLAGLATGQGPAPTGANDCVFPPVPTPIEVAGPHGVERIVARGSGLDPWFQDERGFALVRSGGRFVYARRGPDGRLEPTAHVLGSADPAALGLVPGLRPAPRPPRREKVRAAERPVPGPAFRSGAGSATNLVLLLRFADHGPGGQNRTLPSAADVTKIVDAVGGDPVLAPTGSVRDHYLENSYGQFTIDSTVVGWLDMPGTEEDYAGGISGLGTVVWDLITDGLEAADALVDFGDFDQDGDGWIDAITFLHSGYGAEWISDDQYGTPYECRIWSHKWTIPTWTSDEGVRVGNYNISPGLWGVSGSGPGRIGVVTHELGHFFGLPDLYDTNGSGQGIGNWDVMAAGSWGFDGSQQHPSHMSSWSKAKLGWLEPALLRPGAQVLGELESGANALRLDNGYPPGEYLLIENRQAVGFDSALPQAGLVVWHVDEAKGSFGFNDPNTDQGFPGQSGWPGNGSHYRVAMLQADGDYDMEQNSNRGDSGDPYRSGGGGVTSITGGSSPNLDAYQEGDVIAAGNTITSISAPGAAMTFTYANAALPTIVGAAPAPGRVGAAYASTLTATGATSWSEYREHPSYETVALGPGFPGGGVAQGWNADEEVWSLALPFPFPFYETQYTTLYVSSNGFVDFVPCTSEPVSDPLYMRSSLRIAPLWADLTTEGANEDVYVESAADHVRVRWAASSFESGAPVNVAVLLRDDGTIRFEYGSGNQGLTPVVGIARGIVGDFVLAPGYTGSGDLDGANGLELRLSGSRLPAGLHLDPSGLLSGVPLEAGVFRPLVRATDAQHRYDQRELLLFVAPRAPRALDLAGLQH